MRIVVIHYHLLPGGVTDVICESVRAIATGVAGVDAVTLVAGRRDNTDLVLDRLADLPVQVACEIVPQIDYTDPTEPTAAAHDRADAIERLLLDRFTGDDVVWWVHNYHIGKNPSLTLALCRIASLEAAPAMLLHIHDFPECARYENLAYLERVTGRSPYPAGPGVRYAVINARDRRLLVAAGVPEARVALLLNPVGPGGPVAAAHLDRDFVVARLADYAADNGQRFHPEGPLLLYPVRTIRRKNVVEMAALARLVERANLIVTLPGVSEPERPYSDLVRFAYEDRRVHGIWGIAARESEYSVSYEAIAGASDAIVSSSVQEGFGLLFVNTLRWRKPLVARRLDVIESLDPLFDDYPATLYDSFRVPTRSPSVTSMQAYLRMRYAERLDEIGSSIPETARERLEDELDRVLARDAIDFSYLPAQLQLTVLGDLREPGFGALVKAMNGDIVSALERAAAIEPPATDERIEALLGYESYAAAFERLWSSAAGGAGGSGTEPESGGVAGSGKVAATVTGSGGARFEGVRDSLVSSFAELAQLRLLLGPIDHADHG